MTITASTTARPETKSTFWRPAVGAAVVAAVATTVVAAVAREAGASLEMDGEVLPLFAFFQLTLIFSLVGVGIAVACRRWAASPRQAFVRATVALTALSLVPDLLVSVETSTRLTLMTTHLVAAAIVIPVVARLLPGKRA